MWTTELRSDLVSVWLMRWASVMARPLRIEFPGALFSSLPWGMRSKISFIEDEDPQQFLAARARVVSRVHLLLKGDQGVWLLLQQHVI
jgi:hypothetical protein